MAENHINQEEYVSRILDAYRKTPGTMGTVRRPDRLVAVQLHQRGVPLIAVENALLLAAARRMIRPTGAAPLSAIRSLAYFLPVIQEVLSCASTPTTSAISATRSNAPSKLGKTPRLSQLVLNCIS
jgi:hypothetical protein